MKKVFTLLIAATGLVACGDMPEPASVHMSLPQLSGLVGAADCDGGVNHANNLANMRVRLYVGGYLDQPCGLAVNTAGGGGNFSISGQCTDILADSIRNLYVVYTLPPNAGAPITQEKALALIAGWVDLRSKTGTVNVNVGNESNDNFRFVFEQAEFSAWPEAGLGANVTQAQQEIKAVGPMVANNWVFNNSAGNPADNNLNQACLGTLF